MDNRDLWMHLHARPIDLARWEYLQGNCDAPKVVEALAWYQNDDGGFGHGLEADNWNPNSSPIQTWKAISILRELNYFNRELPLVSKMMKFLLAELEQGLWKTLIPSNDAFPHASWWNYDPNAETWGYNPSASLLGYLYRLGEKLEGEVRQALDYYLAQSVAEMHEFPLFMDLYFDLRHTNWDSRELLQFKHKLEGDLKKLLVTNPDQWAGYGLRPSSIFTPDHREFILPYEKAIEQEKQYLLRTANADGTWEVPWDWGQFPQEFTLAREWWQAELIIRYTRFLQLF